MTILNELNENEATPNINGSGLNRTDDDFAQLKNDFDALRNDIKSLFSSLGQVAKGKGSEGIEKGSELADNATEKVRDAQTYVEEKVRANPLAAIGIALGAGFLISSLRK